MSPFLWIILLLMAGVVLIVLELFIPSGGILSFLSLAAVAGAIVLAYYHYDVVTGTTFLAFAAIAMPIVIGAALRWWPNTPMGRRILIRPPAEEELFSTDDLGRAMRHLIGKRGVAKSPLLPAGAVSIEGRIYDAISEAAPIESGQPIEVVEATGNHIVVRGLAADAPMKELPSDDILSRPLDSLGLEELDDPLA
jgi:membrane-bound ClpP family serine protease